MSSFRVFKPQKGFFLTNNMVVSSLFGLSFLLFIVEKYVLGHSSNLSILATAAAFFMLSAFALSIIFGAMSTFKYKPFRGELLELMYFYNDKIVYKDEVYFINDLKAVDVYANDYSGSLDSGRDFNWKISNGTGNTIVLITEDRKKITYNFQILNEGDIFKIKDQLIHYHLANKISWLRLLDILSITDYDEIQQFKKVVAGIRT
jgi:hypothetical protein